MKTPGIYIGALAVFCIAALVIGSAGASAMMQKGTLSPSRNTCGKGLMQGEARERENVSSAEQPDRKGIWCICYQCSSDKRGFAMTLLKEFRTTHPDAFSTLGVGTGKDLVKGVADETRMLEMLDNLTAKGYDVSAIRIAVGGGDYETAMTLLKEFITANPDATPRRGDGNIGWQMGGERWAKNT